MARADDGAGHVAGVDRRRHFNLEGTPDVGVGRHTGTSFSPKRAGDWDHMAAPRKTA